MAIGESIIQLKESATRFPLLSAPLLPERFIHVNLLEINDLYESYK